MVQTGFRQPNSPSKKPPLPDCSLMFSAWLRTAQASGLCPASAPPANWQASCSCSFSTLLSKCPPSLRVESTLNATFAGLIPPNTESSSWPGVCKGTGKCVGGTRSVIIWGGKLEGGAWGGRGWELGELDFFMASPTTVSLSSSFSFPTNKLGQEVHDSTSGELPMVSCMCMGSPVTMGGMRPNALVCLNA